MLPLQASSCVCCRMAALKGEHLLPVPPDNAEPTALCSVSAQSLHPRLAQGLLHAAAAGLMRVLLHGGPDRCAFLAMLVCLAAPETVARCCHCRALAAALEQLSKWLLPGSPHKLRASLMTGWAT